MSNALMDFALRLEKDIRSRRLEPGSRYLTADESARLLGTSVTTANRVLRILAEKDVVVRRRNSGTFVGPAIAATQITRFPEVIIFLPTAYRATVAVRLDLVIEGVLANMPDVAEVRTCYVPSHDCVEFVRNTVDPSSTAGRLAGVLAISCSRDVYKFLGENDYPLVVYGSLYADQAYPSIDTDEREAGALLAGYLIERGHRRLAMFSATENCPGDNYFRDGATDSLAAVGLPANALILRLPGSDPAVLREQVLELFDLPEPPTGFIVNQPRWADDVAHVVRGAGPMAPEKTEIVFSGFPVGEPGASNFPHARPRLSYREIGLTLGEALARVRQRAPLEQRTIRIPYKLCPEPEFGVVG